MSKELTFDEKIRLVTGVGSWHTYDANGKLKTCILHDGPHGLRKQEEGASNNDSIRATCFPPACAVAAGWNPELADKMARAIAQEAIAEGVAVVLGPGTNIKRSPTCGRNFEYYSEDPYLAGTLATAFINAMQEEGVGTSLKHFAANNQETYRMTGNSRVDERTLREIYLSAFERAVKESQPATIMASYNMINGTYSCENKWLLTDVCRKEWGFEGLFVSDWGACGRLSESIEAGMDLEMPDTYGNHAKLLKKDIEDGKISAESLDRAVAKIVALNEKYGRTNPNTSDEDKNAILDKNHELAVSIESECAVLLKNEGILPLKDSVKPLIIGGMATNVRFQGGGSSHINTGNVRNAVEAFAAEGVTCDFAEGYDDRTVKTSQKLFDEAVEAAVKAKELNQPVLFFGGLTDTSEGEGYDRKDFGIPENQKLLLEKICSVNPNTIFVAFGGSPFDMSAADNAAAILMMYLGGEGVMEAAAKLLLGKENPSGKLPETFPYAIEDTPCYGNYATTSRNADYKERFFVGYRFYDSFDKKVRYPFGFGLSYTQFKYSDMKIDRNGQDINITLTVTNVGDCSGAETVQIYVCNPKNEEIERAKRELRGFKKVKLGKEESQEVCFTLTERDFSIYDTKQGRYAVVPGEYVIEAAACLGDVRCSAAIDFSEGEYPMPYGPHIDFDEWVRDYPDLDLIGPGKFTVQNSLGQLSKHSLLAKMVLSFAKWSVLRMFKDKPKDDPEVMMFYETACEGTLDGVVNAGGGKIPYRIAEAIVLSANGSKFKSFLKLFR